LIGSKSLLLFNRKPYKYKISFSKYADQYKDKSMWFSIHGETYLRNNAVDKFPNASQDNSIPVRLLIVSGEDNPDLLIQRIKNNLFISEGTVKYVERGKEVIELRCPTRISNKLFPEITEKDGIVGVMIEVIQ
jgi:hypothetical protein